MKIHLDAIIHFDGTTLAMEILSLSDEDTGKPLIGTHGDLPDAKAIIYLREHGLEIFDRRRSGAPMAKPEAEGEAQLKPKSGARIAYNPVLGFHSVPAKPSPLTTTPVLAGHKDEVRL